VKRGAFDFLLKPWDNKKLLSTIYSALQLCKSLKENAKLRSIQMQLRNDLNRAPIEIFGESKLIQKVLIEVDRVAQTEANVLITGDSGVGKELVARLIHRKSHRKEAFFYRVDLASIHSSLFESELFGYEKGAFTDAKESKPGKFEIADGGTLLLDEIASVDIQQQAKLLSVLQNRKATRLGSTLEKDLDFRLITTTNKPIKDLVKAGLFREDLFFRINTFEIRVPRLAERTEDIPVIANFYVDKFAAQYNKQSLKISAREMISLQKYKFPGNVRELINIIERSVILSDGKALDFNGVLKSSRPMLKVGEGSLNISEIEENAILKAIEKCNGNMTLAAKELGLTRSSFYRRLEKYGIK
jgi:DNA-binding NtrC family response regulator